MFTFVESIRKIQVMKIFRKLLLVSFVIVLFVSCDRGDDFSYTRREVTKTHTYSFHLFGNEGPNLKYIDPVFLSEAIGEEAAKKIIKAELSIDSCYVEFAGVRDASLELRSVVIELRDSRAVNPPWPPKDPVIADRERFDFGNFNADRQLTNATATFFFETLFFFYNHEAKDPIIIISFNASKDFTREDSDVRLNIQFKGTYHYIEVN
jgi:hypothetical protein